MLEELPKLRKLSRILVDRRRRREVNEERAVSNAEPRGMLDRYRAARYLTDCAENTPARAVRHAQEGLMIGVISIKSIALRGHACWARFSYCREQYQAESMACARCLRDWM